MCNVKHKQSKERENMFHGCKIYKPTSDYNTLTKEFTDLSFNTFYISEELALNETFLSSLPKGAQTLLIAPILYDNDTLLDEYPEASAIKADGSRATENWVSFICPNQKEIINSKVTKYIQLAQKAHCAFISLDFIRYFSFWEQIVPNNTDQTCFCPSCIHEFTTLYNCHLTTLHTSTEEIAKEILSKYSQQFTAYKCAKISNLVAQIAEQIKEHLPHIKLSLHIVPWFQQEHNKALTTLVGQDIKALSKHVDILSPMCYAHMLHKSPNWISLYLQELQTLTSKPIVPSIQVSTCYRDDKLSESSFIDYINAISHSNVNGLIYWSWENLEKAPEKKELIKRALGK